MAGGGVAAYRAAVRVSGGLGELEAFRERVRALLVRDIDAPDYTERYADGQLELHFETDRGLPFPTLATASGDFAGLRVEIEWHTRAVAGRAVFQAGQIIERDLHKDGE